MLWYLQIGNAILALAVNAGVQIICMRWVSEMGLLKSIFCGFGAGLIFLLGIDIYIGFSLHIWHLNPPYIFVDLLTYGALGYCYFHFINLGETARRIRILREFYEAGGVLSRSELLQRYNAEEMVAHRLNRMLANGQIVERDGNYYIGKPTLLLIANMIAFMKRLILGKSSELE